MATDISDSVPTYKFYCVKCELEVDAWKAQETEEGPYHLTVTCHGTTITIIVPAAEWPLHNGVAFKAHVFSDELNGQKVVWWPPPWMWPGLTSNEYVHKAS